jgi:type IV pilus assembly protein PilY1
LSGWGRYFFKQGINIDDSVSQRLIMGIKEPCYDSKLDNACTATVNFADLADVTNDVAAPEDDEGWFIYLDLKDIPDAGFDAERVTTDPVASATSVVYYTTFKPSSDVCGYGGRSHLWAVCANTGGECLDKIKGKALIQVSTGSIEEIDLKKAIKSRKSPEIIGKPPEGPGLILLSAPPPYSNFVHIRER